MSVQFPTSKAKEYEFLRTEILQYMEEYQTVRNMMYGVTGTILSINSAVWNNAYLFILPFVVILPSYIIFYDYWKSVSVASLYMQVFLEPEGVKKESKDPGSDNAVSTTDKELYRWEGRHRRFGDLYDEQYLYGLKGWVLRHAQRLLYYVCALACLLLFAVKAGVFSLIDSGKPNATDAIKLLCFAVRVNADFWTLVALCTLCILIFICYHEVNTENIEKVMNDVKEEDNRITKGS